VEASSVFKEKYYVLKCSSIQNRRLLHVLVQRQEISSSVLHIARPMIQGVTKISVPPSATALGGILLAMPWTWGLTYCIYSLHSKGPYLFTINMDNLSQYVSNCCEPALSNFLK
jgi:hypothetical protein